MALVPEGRSPASSGRLRDEQMSNASVLVRALLAYSVHEHQAGSATRLRIRLTSHSCTVEDDGRGIGLDRDGYVRGLVEQLAARRGEVALHGIGLAIVAMASPRLTIESRRAGRRYSQRYSWGVAEDSVSSEPTGEASGTRLTLMLPLDAPPMESDKVLAQVQIWRTAHPNLQIDVDTGQ